MSDAAWRRKASSAPGLRAAAARAGKREGARHRTIGWLRASLGTAGAAPERHVLVPRQHLLAAQLRVGAVLQLVATHAGGVARGGHERRVVGRRALQGRGVRAQVW
jgi:hypothetical protein